MCRNTKVLSMKKWFIVEEVTLTVVPVALLLYALPYLFVGAIFIVAPMESDTRVWYERVFGMFPYLGGGLGLWTIWRNMIALSNGIKFRLDLWFFLAGIGGALASWELIRTTNFSTGIFISLPVWILLCHILYLRNNLQLFSLSERCK